MLDLQLLGEVQVLRDGARIELPPSRKTRALLAYLVATGRPHRRERLCTLFWEIPDDPRGALRWSLSRLRTLVDEPSKKRIVADRESVSFDPNGATIDLAELRRMTTNGILSLSAEELQRLAAMFRGEFLEGVDLPDLHDFQAWCLAEREDIRRMQAHILSTLIGRLAEQPANALPHARQLVQIDPFNDAARISLLQFLVALGRRDEAEQHFEAAVRVFKELGDNAEANLVKTWRALRTRPTPPTQAPAVDDRAESAPVVAAAAPDAATPDADDRSASPLVGRASERARLVQSLDEASASHDTKVVLLVGEPGLGKSNLIEDFRRTAQQRGAATFLGHAYEIERDFAYGPWIEALGGIPVAAASEAASDGLDEMVFSESSMRSGRERLFAQVAQAVFASSDPSQPVVLAIDDVQWCDEASANLLHYIVRLKWQRPFVVVMAARDGELADNPAMLAVLRSLRHGRLLQEIRLEPLSAAEIGEIVGRIAPNVDARRVIDDCAGNPLFALELARNAATEADELPRSLKELVRDRIERLPDGSADLLRWASVVGPTFSLNRLMLLLDLDVDVLMERLQVLERHALLRAIESERQAGWYRFGHDLIYRAIYTGISEPRRRLMHLKIARALYETGAGDESVASDVAHHAGLAGEASLAAAACVKAGRRSLRVFANEQAATVARRGMRYAEGLAERERVERLLELIQIEYVARRPTDPGKDMDRIEKLSNQALDLGSLAHARLGFHLLSWLRWEGGQWSDAQRDTLRAEFVSRGADARHRVFAMAESARCLAMLERDLDQADALVIEARALGERLGIDANAFSDAAGLLQAHAGAYEDAISLFTHARAVARRDGDRASEFLALEHHVCLEIQRHHFDVAEALCSELIDLAEKLREGSEEPFARALYAVCCCARGAPERDEELENCIEAVRVADAKHRLAFTLLSAAELDIERAQWERARARAEEALQMAELLERPSEIVLAHAALAQIALAQREDTIYRRHVTELQARISGPVSRLARSAAEAVLKPATNSILARTAAGKKNAEDMSPPPQ